MHESEKWKWSHSVASDPQRPHGLQPTRLLRPWESPGKSTGVGCHCLLQSTTRASLKEESSGRQVPLISLSYQWPDWTKKHVLLVVPFVPPLHQLCGKVLTFTPCSAFSQLNNSFPSNKTYGQIFPCLAFLLHICYRVSSLVNYAYE